MRSGLLLLVAVVACGTPAIEDPDAGTSDAGQRDDAGEQCAPPVLCFPGCTVATPGCQTGTLDLDACVCRDAAGAALPWPDPAATAVEMFFDPAPPATIAVGEELVLGVRVRFTDGVVRDATEQASWDLSPADAVEDLSGGRWKVKRGANLLIDVSWNGFIGGATITAKPVEARAVWITRFGWSTESDVRRLVNDAADANFNVVFFQVRANGDAYYDSALEPWAAKLGKLGQDPGWDPLQVAIDVAHGRGIELHAYVNAFTGWAGSAEPPASPAGEPTHPLRLHPEWLERTESGATDGDGYQWLSPGIEAVRAHNVAVVQDLLSRYDVDGIHLDRIRYAGSGFGWNALSRQAFTASGSTDFAAWRVAQVNDQVRRIHDAILATKPEVKLTASVWGIHTRLQGCTTSQGKNDYFQDSWAWSEGGYLDALVPMIYWAEDTGCTDFGDLLQTFLDHRGGGQVWAGMHVWDKSASCSGTCKLNWNELLRRIDTSRAKGALGMAMFASNYLDQDAVWPMLESGPFEVEAMLPPVR